MIYDFDVSAMVTGRHSWFKNVFNEAFVPSRSHAEIEVLAQIAAGNSNKRIADRLAITEETVKGHVRNILSKLGAGDRTHAVTSALRRGIIEL